MFQVRVTGGAGKIAEEGLGAFWDGGGEWGGTFGGWSAGGTRFRYVNLAGVIVVAVGLWLVDLVKGGCGEWKFDEPYLCVRIDVLSVMLGEKSVEYPKRFFARDYAGNRLEFSL
jgi:hypothetical protein